MLYADRGWKISIRSELTYIMVEVFVLSSFHVSGAISLSPELRGDEFRPMFGSLRAHTRVPFMALTAMASDTTATAIIKSLHLDQPVIISRSLDRHNLYFSLGPVKSLKVSTEC